MSWEQLDTVQSKAFLDAVQDEQHKILFEPSICKLYRLALPFYDGYYLYRISNQYTIPFMQLDYLSNGEDHYYMDGSEDAFHNLNARGAISLDRKNAFHYLNLYISYVYERGNSMGFEGDFDHSEVTEDDESDNYIVSTKMTYQNQEVKGVAEITPAGAIHIKQPLEVSFLETPKPTSKRPYRHEHAKSILNDITALLATTKNGQRLAGIAEKYKPFIHIFNSPDYQSFSTNTRHIFLTMPAVERSGKYMQAIMLAGALADFEQILSGFTHPHITENADTFGPQTLAKNLDMVTEMCKIVQEWQEQNIPEGVDALQQMGFAGLYHAYMSGSPKETLSDLYLTALKEQGIIVD